MAKNLDTISPPKVGPCDGKEEEEEEDSDTGSMPDLVSGSDEGGVESRCSPLTEALNAGLGLGPGKAGSYEDFISRWTSYLEGLDTGSMPDLESGSDQGGVESRCSPVMELFSGGAEGLNTGRSIPYHFGLDAREYRELFGEDDVGPCTPVGLLDQFRRLRRRTELRARLTGWNQSEVSNPGLRAYRRYDPESANGRVLWGLVQAKVNIASHGVFLSEGGPQEDRRVIMVSDVSVPGGYEDGSLEVAFFEELQRVAKSMGRVLVALRVPPGTLCETLKRAGYVNQKHVCPRLHKIQGEDNYAWPN